MVLSGILISIYDERGMGETPLLPNFLRNRPPQVEEKIIPFRST